MPLPRVSGHRGGLPTGSLRLIQSMLAPGLVLAVLGAPCGGKPEPPACGAGSTTCGDACVDTTHDPAHCGGCGTACPSGQVCSSGVCAVTCLGGTTLCGSACVNPSI